MQQIYEYCWNHFGKKSASDKTLRFVAKKLLTTKKKKNKISTLQAYYHLHFHRYKDIIQRGYMELEAANPGTMKLVNYRNQSMREFLAAEPNDVRASIEEYRQSHNTSLTCVDDSAIDWGSLDSSWEVASATEDSSSADSVESKDSPAPSTSDTVTPAQDSSSDDSPEQEVITKAEPEDRVQQLLLRQR